jgi:murein DD-endopeptidase MepM/ murein hydrolase activator NlpD
VIRGAIAAGTAVILGSAAVGTASALHDTGAALGRIVAEGTAGVSVDDAPDHRAVLHAPAGTAVMAVAEGRPAMASGGAGVASPGDLLLHGTGEDRGLDVDYAGLDTTVSSPVMRRGDVAGHVLDATHTVTVRAVLDGRPLDTAPLLRAALDGVSHAGGAWTRPVDGAFVSQGFGCTPFAMEPVDRACASGHIHTGIDLAVPMGTPVRAALDGVAHVVESASGFGLHVVLDHGSGLTTLYAHLQSAGVHDGDEVAAGDVIGGAGSTGNSTGPHLHFEVRRDGIPEDPALDVALP